MLVDILPSFVQNNLPIIALLIIGFFVENHYVSRLSVFSNTIALNVYVNSINSPGILLSLYADLGFLLGVVGLLAYLLEEELGGYYYPLVYFAFSSATVGIVLLVPIGLVWFAFALVIGGISNYLLLNIFKELAAPIA